jgi:iron complex outermembrane receptor protein
VFSGVNRSMHRKLAALLIVPSIVLSNPFETTLQDEIQWLEEETFVVSASRVKENIKKTPASITVIDSDMIEKMGATTIFDLLATVPGIRITQDNLYVDRIEVRGIQTSFSEKVLFLLDGHSLNIDLLNGGATGTYKNFPLEIIDRIEIIKGPASALYGENAFNALINIITKKPDDINGLLSTFKYGSDEKRTANFLYGKTCKNINLKTNLNIEKSEGDDRFIQSDALGNSAKIDPELKSINAYLSLEHKNGLYLTSNFNNTQDGQRYGITKILNNKEDLSKKKTYFIETGYKNRIGEDFDIQAKIYIDKFDAKNTWKIVNNIYQTNYQTQKTGAEILLSYQGNSYKIISGISHEKQEVNDGYFSINYLQMPTFIEDHDKTFEAAFAEVLYDINPKLRLNIGGRYDDYSDFGGTFNPRMGTSYEINRNNNIKLMYGEAFRSPNFAELYNANNPALAGNPDLKPEKVKTIEISFENNHIKSLDLKATVFQSKIDDIIVEDANTYVNQGKVKTKGIEAELKYELYRGSYILFNYTYQNPKNETDKTDIANIAKQSAYAALNYRISQNYNLYLDAEYTGEQTRDLNDTRKKVGSSVIANASLLIKNSFFKNTSMKFSIDNIFDKQTYDSSDLPFDYPQSRRKYMVELKYRF